MRAKVVLAILLGGLLLLGGVLWLAPQRTKAPTVATQAPVEAPSEPEASRPDSVGPESPADVARTAATAAATALKTQAAQQLRQAMAVRAPLDAEQLGTLYEVLREPQSDDANQNGHVYKNALMNALNRIAPLPADVIDLYAAIYRDTNQNDVIRDYALQHAAEAHDKLDGATSKAQAAALLWEAAARADSSRAGTAILGLARLAATDASLDPGQIARAAVELARNPAADDAARISALQVLGRVASPAAVALLAQTAGDANSVMLQVSAIGALGQTGGRTEVDLLNRLAADGDQRLKLAAGAALRRIQERTGKL